MKYIFLCCLFLSSAYMPAQLGQEKLEKLMHDNFGVSATPENILSARNERGESILHVIYRDVVRASNNQEIGSLAEAKGQIEDETVYELDRAVDQEGHSVIHFVIKIAKENALTGANNKLDTFCSIEQIHKNIRRPRPPCEGCSWQQRALWAGGTAIGTALCTLAGVAFITHRSGLMSVLIEEISKNMRTNNGVNAAVN